MQGFFDAVPSWLPSAAGIVLLIIVIVAVGRIQAKKRTAALALVAQELGFDFRGTVQRDAVLTPHIGTALFERGRSRKFRNLMTGSYAGFRTSTFDYTFTIRIGRRSITYIQTVIAFSKESAFLPKFDMQPEGVLQKIGDVFVRKDINFDSHPEFSRSYQLRSPEVDKTRRLFSPPLLSFIEGLDRKRKWRLEGLGNTLIVYRLGMRAKPDNYRTHLEQTSSIASSFFSLAGPTG